MIYTFACYNLGAVCHCVQLTSLCADDPNNERVFWLEKFAEHHKLCILYIQIPKIYGKLLAYLIQAKNISFKVSWLHLQYNNICFKIGLMCAAAYASDAPFSISILSKFDPCGASPQLDVPIYFCFLRIGDFSQSSNMYECYEDKNIYVTRTTMLCHPNRQKIILETTVIICGNEHTKYIM